MSIKPLSYKGYVIKPQVEQTLAESQRPGAWLAGAYSISRPIGDLLREKRFSHDPEIFETKKQAIERTVSFAKEAIDRELVGF
jgi:hypothetical protein